MFAHRIPSVVPQAITEFTVKSEIFTPSNLFETQQEVHFRLTMCHSHVTSGAFLTVDSETSGQELSIDVGMSRSKIESW
jgi:hypothetical protein